MLARGFRAGVRATGRAARAWCARCNPSPAEFGVSSLQGLGAIGGFVGAPLQRWELRARDFLARHGAKAQVDSRLVFLGIDNESVSLDPLDFDTLFADVPRDSADFRALQLMGAGWPWSREVHAHILDKLVAAGASAVVFDLMFPKAVGRSRRRRCFPRRARSPRVACPHRQQFRSADHSAKAVAGWVHMRPTETLIPQTSPLDPRVAYVNFWPDDADEIVRRARLRLTEKSLAGFPAHPDSEVLRVARASRGEARGIRQNRAARRGCGIPFPLHGPA